MENIDQVNNQLNHSSNFIKVLTIFFVYFLIVGCSNSASKDLKHHHKDNIAMMVSIATDGKYVVSSQLNGQIVLWDIKNKKEKIIAQHANIYSAYFIKNTNDFMWQNDDTNEVYIENINGKIIKHFNPGFPTYGQVMSTSLNNYIASDETWNLYQRQNGKKVLIKKGYNGFLGAGKLLNLTLSFNNKLLLTSGWATSELDDVPLAKGHNQIVKNTYPVSKTSLLEGVVLWNVKSGQPLYKFPGNYAKTIAAISPNGKYIISVDEDGFGFVWNAATGKRMLELWGILFGKYIKTGPKDSDVKRITKGLIKPPKDFKQIGGLQAGGDMFAVKFIDTKGEYLTFPTDTPYAILYTINDPKPIKYLPLMPKPLPITGDIYKDTDIINKVKAPSNFDYSRDGAIDSAPKANILVMGQCKGDGIIVYKFNAKIKTLKRIWTANFKN